MRISIIAQLRELPGQQGRMMTKSIAKVGPDRAQTWRARLGAAGEQAAANFYSTQGYQLLARNWRAGRYCEVDLIACHESGMLVFVEVKTRRQSTDTAGFSIQGFEAVNWLKQRKIVTAARLFLSRHNVQCNSCRFDVLVILYDIARSIPADSPLPEPQLIHVPDAFTA